MRKKIENETETESARYWPLIAFSIAFFVYWMTLAPDLTGAHYGVDGGELITTAVTLGIPHPPGYPTYTLLGKLVSLLPIGTVAYRFNLFSAAAMATAVGLIAVVRLPSSVVKRHTRLATDYSPLVAALVFAFAPLVWSQAIITEVYALNLAFLAAFLWALLGKRPSFFTGILLGLSLTTHLSSALMLPLALLLVPWRDWLKLALGLALGLTPLLTLPWLAGGDSPIVWGDPTTLQGWFWLVSGRLYQNNLFGIAPTDLMARLQAWGALLLRQFAWIGLPLLIFAFYQAKGPVLRAQLGLLGTAVLTLIYALGYAASDAVVFTLPALLLLSLLLTPGLRWLGRWAWLLPLASLLLNYSAIDLSGDRTVRPLAENLLQNAPPNAILLTPGDQTIFTLWYFQHVEEQRPDLILADANLLAFDWYRVRLRQLYPDLNGLGADDLTHFRQTNQARRPFCTAALQTESQLDCSMPTNP